MQVMSDRLVGISRAVTDHFTEGKNHGTINSDLGMTDDELTKALYESLGGTLKR